MKPVLVLKQDGMAVQLGPIQVPLGQRDSNLFYNPGVTSLRPTESFYGPRALDIDHDAERLAQLGVNVDLAMTPERRSGTMRSKQEKYESKMPLQERIARNLSSQVDPTDKAGQEAAFQQALDRTGLGANIGRYASYGLGGLAGLMALQRANESGTDLFSALGSAGTTGYLTQRQLQPALQRLGMRAAGKTLSPSVGETSLPPTSISSADETPFAYQEGESKFTPADSQASFTAPTIAKPTVAEPTVQTKLPGAPPTPLSEKTYADMTGTELGEMNSDRDSMTGQSSIDEENQEKFQSTLEEYDRMNTVRDDFDEIYDSYNKMNKGNRRSFVGVR